MNTVKYSCLENPHGQRSLVGYSPWGHKESDLMERLGTKEKKKKNILGGVCLVIERREGA